jgi:hypothetical protein
MSAESGEPGTWIYPRLEDLWINGKRSVLDDPAVVKKTSNSIMCVRLLNNARHGLKYGTGDINHIKTPFLAVVDAADVLSHLMNSKLLAHLHTSDGFVG